MAKYHRNLSERIRKIQAITQEHYEVGNYSKSYYQVWRNYVYPVYPCCYATFLKYINTRPSNLSNDLEKRTYNPETVRKIRMSQEIAQKYYQPKSRQTCYKAVWRKHIQPFYPIDYGVFIKYLKVKPSDLTDHENESGVKTAGI